MGTIEEREQKEAMQITFIRSQQLPMLPPCIIHPCDEHSRNYIPYPPRHSIQDWRMRGQLGHKRLALKTYMASRHGTPNFQDCWEDLRSPIKCLSFKKKKWDKNKTAILGKRIKGMKTTQYPQDNRPQTGLSLSLTSSTAFHLKNNPEGHQSFSLH